MIIQEIFRNLHRPEDVRLRRVNTLMAFLATIGLLLSAYLWYLHVQSQLPYCPTGGCSVALTSPWAYFLGFPVAAWGAVFYVSIFSNAVMRLLDNRKLWNITMMLLLAVGFFFTFYLRVVEIAILHDFCIWCWGSVLILLGIISLNYIYTTKLRKRKYNELACSILIYKHI